MKAPKGQLHQLFTHGFNDIYFENLRSFEVSVHIYSNDLRISFELLIKFPRKLISCRVYIFYYLFLNPQSLEHFHMLRKYTIDI